MNQNKIKELQSYIKPGTVNLLILDTFSLFNVHNFKHIFGQEIISLDDLYLNSSATVIKEVLYRKIVEKGQQKVRNTQEKIIYSYRNYLGTHIMPLSFTCHTVFECDKLLLKCKKNFYGSTNFEMILVDEFVYKWIELIKS